MFSSRLIQFSLLALITAPFAAADVIISNLAAPLGTGTIFGAGATTQFKAMGFTMGAAPYDLDDATISMNFPSAGSTPVVSIWSDAGGVLGMELFVLDNPAVISGQQEFVFTAGSLFTLQANTTYWLHVKSDPLTSPDFFWDGTNPATLPTGIATSVGYNFNGSSSSFFNRCEINGTSEAGTTFCDPNSTNCAGLSTKLSGAFGSGIESDLHLSVTDGPPNEFGYFLVSAGMSDPGIALSNGMFCLADGTNPFGRYNVTGTTANSVGVFSADGSTFNNLVGTGTSAGNTGFDVPSLVPISGSPTIMTGQTWNFQLWHRDACSTSGASNFSNGLSMPF